MFLKLRLCIWSCVLGCVMLQACRPEDPFADCYEPPAEVKVVGNQLLAGSLHEKGVRVFTGLNDTLPILQVEKHYFWFVMNARSFKNMVQRPKSEGFHFFNQAYACSPLFYVFTKQRLNGFRVFSDRDFGTEYPAGSDLSRLFVQADHQHQPNGMSLLEVMEKHGLNVLLNNVVDDFLFVGSAPAGSVTRFEWELTMDEDTIRSTSPYVLF